jgi:hypothetical protein
MIYSMNGNIQRFTQCISFTVSRCMGMQISLTGPEAEHVQLLATGPSGTDEKYARRSNGDDWL